MHEAEKSNPDPYGQELPEVRLPETPEVPDVPSRHEIERGVLDGLNAEDEEARRRTEVIDGIIGKRDNPKCAHQQQKIEDLMMQENGDPVVMPTEAGGVMDDPAMTAQIQAAQPEVNSNYERELEERLENVSQSMARLESEISLFEGYPLWYRFLHQAKDRALKESYDIAAHDRQLLEDRIKEVRGFSESAPIG